MAKPTITQERLKELLDYDPATGFFRWRIRLGRKNPNVIAGEVNRQGRRIISVDRHRYLATRLAWLWMTGAMAPDWPAIQIDHIDGNVSNDQFANLRLASAVQNGQNRKIASKRSRSGYLGVSTIRGKYFQANIKTSTGRIYLGSFDNPIAAHKAYVEAKRRFHDFGEL